MDTRKELDNIIRLVKLNGNTLEALKKAVSGTSVECDFTEEEIESIFNSTKDIKPNDFIGVGATEWTGYAGLGGDAYPYKVVWCDGDIMVLRELNFTIDDLTIGEGTISELMNDNIIVCKYKKNKGWFIKGTKTRVIVGYARAYRNPSF